MLGRSHDRIMETMMRFTPLGNFPVRLTRLMMRMNSLYV
jgi:hypothetical protein